MATWGVHLRVARCFIDNLIAKKYHREFVIGSVAPDCGYGVKDSFGEFTPPPKITHWSPSGMKRDCRYNDFQKEYLNDKSNADYWRRYEQLRQKYHEQQARLGSLQEARENKLNLF